MEYHPKFKKRIQQTAQAAKWSLFHTGMFLDGITTLNWAGIQIYGGYKRFRPESITAYCIGLKLIDLKHEGEIWCGLKFFTEVLWYMWSSLSRWSMRVLHLGYSSEALWATVNGELVQWKSSAAKNQSRDMKFKPHGDVFWMALQHWYELTPKNMTNNEGFYLVSSLFFLPQIRNQNRLMGKQTLGGNLSWTSRKCSPRH